jgi:dipeptide/tripeptide permease
MHASPSSTEHARVADSPANARRAFVTVLLIELQQRFGYGGIAVLLVLFMVQQLGMDDARVNLIWGAFSVMIFAALAGRCHRPGAITAYKALVPDP